MLAALQTAYDTMNPDIVLTEKVGIGGGFPGWLSRGDSTANPSCWAARPTPSNAQHTNGRFTPTGKHATVWSAFFLNGRLHIDLKNSFIVSEGGLSGLFELAQHSRQSAQIVSRLSPGSVISAIQMRVAMDDGVLVPWKKNRPEDTKSALDLLQADRGGLYLDSRPGVHASVIELDFASLFPSIIATRNISPETLNCSCCQPPAASSLEGIRSAPSRPGCQ